MTTTCDKPRVIQRDADPSVFITAIVTNSEIDLTTATVEIGYAGVHDGYPTSMGVPDDVTHPDSHTIHASLLITSLIPVGEYELWVRVTSLPQQVPMRAGRFNVV